MNVAVGGVQLTPRNGEGARWGSLSNVVGEELGPWAVAVLPGAAGL